MSVRQLISNLHNINRCEYNKMHLRFSTANCSQLQARVLCFVQEGARAYSLLFRSLKSTSPILSAIILRSSREDCAISYGFAHVSRLQINVTFVCIYILQYNIYPSLCFMSIRHCTSRKNLLRTHLGGTIAELQCLLTFSSVCFRPAVVAWGLYNSFSLLPFPFQRKWQNGRSQAY